MRLASAADGGGTDCQISDRMRNSVDTTSAGIAFATLSWHQGHCVGTARSEAISPPPCQWTISSLSPREATSSTIYNRCALPATLSRPRPEADREGITPLKTRR